MDALAALSLSLAAMTGMVRDMTPDIARMKKAAGEGYATATDLADWLVRTLKMPFRDAHHVDRQDRRRGVASGRRVASAAARDHEARSSRGSPMRCSACCRSTARSKVVRAMAARRPKNVRSQAKKWLKRLEKKPAIDVLRSQTRSQVTNYRLFSAICYRKRAFGGVFRVRRSGQQGPANCNCGGVVRRARAFGLRPQGRARCAAVGARTMPMPGPKWPAAEEAGTVLRAGQRQAASRHPRAE